MKNRQTFPTAVVTILGTAGALTLAMIMTVHADDRASEVSLPPASLGQPAINPTTGLPIQVPWRDPDWPEPDKVLPDVDYDGLPLDEVVRGLRAEFGDAFDILMPIFWQDPNHPERSLEIPPVQVTMRLKNVTASEVFNAMNLMFEGENTPCRWELRMNGSRPMALLRVVPELVAATPFFPSPAPTPPPLRQIYFVGDLLGDEESGGMSMEQLVKTVSEVYGMSYGSSSEVLKYHEGAQLVIVTGTPDQVNFVQQTLSALRDKVRMERRPNPQSGHAKPGTEETKPH